MTKKCTKASGTKKPDLDTGGDNRPGLMAVFMTVSGKMEKSMVKVGSFTLMETFT